MKQGTIICYGDSNTYGYDPRNGSGGRYDKTVRWTGILEEQSAYRIENHGICGRCIPHTEGQLSFVCEQVRGWQALDAPVWMWIMLGTNDLLQTENFTAEQAAVRMEAFLHRLDQEPAVRSGRLRLLLIAPPRLQYGAWVNERRLLEESERMGGEYKKTAQKLRIPFADAGKWDIPVLFDGVHLSEEGHRRFAEAALELVRTIS